MTYLKSDTNLQHSITPVDSEEKNKHVLSIRWSALKHSPFFRSFTM